MGEVKDLKSPHYAKGCRVAIILLIIVAVPLVAIISQNVAGGGSRSRPQESSGPGSEISVKKPRRPSWKDHPVYRANASGVTPPILAWYITRVSPQYAQEVSSRGRYTRRASRFTLTNSSLSRNEATQLHEYDLLVLPESKMGASNIMVEFETTRESRLCLVMSVGSSDTAPRATRYVPGLPNHTFLGQVKWDTNFTYTSGSKLSSFDGNPIGRGLCACRLLRRGMHNISHPALFKTPFKVASYNLAFGEADGSRPPLTRMPNGWKLSPIVQHTRCPNELHEMWKLESHDAADKDIQGKKWSTWHPQKDYLYGCYYGHEHGIPGMLAGYEERYGYVAWKNNRQDESHEGFKSYVLAVSDVRVFVSIHANTRDIGRVNIPHHTMVIAVLQGGSGKLLFEMSCKANFGGSFASLKRRVSASDREAMIPVGDEINRRLISAINNNSSDPNMPRPRKRINVVNEKDLDERLLYKTNRKGQRLGRGLYEKWIGGFNTTAFCLEVTSPGDAVELDIKNSETGCRHINCTESVLLGMKARNRMPFRPNKGSNRALVFRNVRIDPRVCRFSLKGPGKEGYTRFYTDPYCEKRCTGPSKDCVRQQIHSDFNGVSLHNSYTVTDVHGFNMYQAEYASPWNEGKTQRRNGGYPGIAQLEDALSL